MSHLHPGPISSGSGSKDFSLTSIHVLSQPNLGPYSHTTLPSRQCLNSIQVLIFMCHLKPGHGSPLSRSEDVWHTSINALSHLQSGHSPRLRFTSTHVLISASPTIQVTYHLHQVSEICISAPSRSYLKAIQVSRCVSHIHSGPVSDLSKLQNSCLTSIQVPPSVHPVSYLTSLQVLIFNISHPSRS